VEQPYFPKTDSKIARKISLIEKDVLLVSRNAPLSNTKKKSIHSTQGDEQYSMRYNESLKSVNTN